MSRITYIELAGKKYPLIFSLAASKAISAKFGGIDKIGELLSSGNLGAKEIETISFIITVLIKQGCAYKNMFEADLPPEPGARHDGEKYISLSQEEVETCISLNEAGKIVEKITECIRGSSQTEIEAETETKNMEAPKAE